MELYDKILNIREISYEELIKKAILKTKEDLKDLDYTRMCLVYSSYLYQNLKELSVLSYIIDTKDLTYDYQHRFLLVLDNKDTYLLDLTYRQFNDDLLKDLLVNGYQKIDDDLYSYYLLKVTKEVKDISLKDSIFGKDSFKVK